MSDLYRGVNGSSGTVVWTRVLFQVYRSVEQREVTHTQAGLSAVQETVHSTVAQQRRRRSDDFHVLAAKITGYRNFLYLSLRTVRYVAYTVSGVASLYLPPLAVKY